MEKKKKEQTEAGALELQSSSPLLFELFFSILERFFELHLSFCEIITLMILVSNVEHRNLQKPLGKFC